MKRSFAETAIGALCLVLAGCGAASSPATEAVSSAETTGAVKHSAAEAQSGTSNQADRTSSEAEEQTSETDASGTDTTHDVIRQDEDGRSTRELTAMDTYMTLTVYGKGASSAADEAVKEIRRIDAELSTGNSSSEIAQLNTAGSAEVSDETAQLISRALDISKETNGKFDPAIYPLMELWGFPSGNYRVPTDDEIAQLLPLTDPAGITVSGNTVSFAQTGMAIDLGGIAKGYTSAHLMDLFRKDGIESAIVSLGGNVQVLGAKEDGSPWRIGINNPDDDSSYLGILEETDKAVITSGNYERYFEKNGVRYHHILAPATGKPADTGLTSVTVVCQDGTLADALSTALFVMGEEEGAKFWRSHSDEFQAIFYTAERDLYVTEGLTDVLSTDLDVTTIYGEENAGSDPA